MERSAYDIFQELWAFLENKNPLTPPSMKWLAPNLPQFDVGTICLAWTGQPQKSGEEGMGVKVAIIIFTKAAVYTSLWLVYYT